MSEHLAAAPHPPAPASGEVGVDPAHGHPTYFDDPVLDQLLSVVTELGAALWVVKERLAALEGVLEHGEGLAPGAVEEFARDEERQRQWLAERDAFVDRLFRPLVDPAHR